MVPCSGWESKTCQIWYVLKPQSKTCLSTATPCLLKAKYKQRTDKFKPPFSALIPSKKGRDALHFKSRIFTSTTLRCLEKPLGYSSAGTLPMVLRSTAEGRSPSVCATQQCTDFQLPE